MKHHIGLQCLIAVCLAIGQALLTFTGASAQDGPPYPDPEWELIFVKPTPEGNSIAISDINGEKIRLIGESIPSYTIITLLAISPDGRQIAYRLDGAGVFDDHIRLINSDGSNDQTFLNGRNPSFSPNGKNMVLELGGWLFIADIAARKSVPLRVLPGVEKTMPAWSPDGEHIAFIGYEKEKFKEGGDLYIAAVDANFVIEIETKVKLDQYSQISWSPDGSQLAFASEDGNLYLYNLTTRETTNLTNQTSGSNFSPAWSPDGDWLMYYGTPVERSESSGDQQVHQWLMAHLTGSRIDHLVELHLPSASGQVMINPATHIKSGRDYQVTMLGDYLNLRKEPSTSAEVITMLRTGETVTPVDGPSEADGYRWWQVSVGQTGVTGWLADEPGWLRPVSQNAERKPE